MTVSHSCQGYKNRTGKFVTESLSPLLSTHHSSLFFFFFILWIYDIQEQTLNLIKENSKRQRNTTGVYRKKSLPLFVGVFDGCNCERCVPLGSFHLMISRPDGLLLSPAGSVTVHLISAGSHYWSCLSAQAEDEVMRMPPPPTPPPRVVSDQ